MFRKSRECSPKIFDFRASGIPAKSVAKSRHAQKNVFGKQIRRYTIPLYPRIRDLREDNDITQTQMGKILSCSQRIYSNYERGEIDIPTYTLIKIVDFFNVSVDYLLNRTNNPHINL